MQAGIKIVRININNIRYADNTTLMEESEELESLLMKMEEESEKSGLKVNIQKAKVIASGPIKPVSPKGSQSWKFIGRTDAEAETPIVWPSDAKNWLIGKDPDAGKDWRREEKGTTEDEMVGCYHRLNGYEFEQTPRVGDGQGCLVCCHGVSTVRHGWATKLNWTDSG